MYPSRDYPSGFNPCNTSTTYEPMHSTPSYNAPDALSSNTTYEPTYSTPSDNTAEYDVSMHMAPAYGMSEYMQNIDYLVSNGADTWPYNTSMPAYIPEMPSAHSDTQGMGLLANNDGMPMYGASMGTYAEQRYTSPTCGEPKYSRPTPVAPSDTRDMCMPMSQAPPDNTELCSIPMATQDVGQFVLTSNMLPYDVSMSVDIVSAYDAPLYTGPVPNAQGVMQVTLMNVATHLRHGTTHPQ
ncbi:hypothetical protein CERSUDRAFT_126077 [Gelatoporia subvermispora B]|uniref:Uncharacterized protein n=1 Tax=Ceriporiopsis subvermispora (strain B) TaxID=914234 RepID=M2Q8V6_CERS8|nr:hypothetical protein CERSUDRAFT_126077 [Gelatoporia subvermispora B]